MTTIDLLTASPSRSIWWTAATCLLGEVWLPISPSNTPSPSATSASRAPSTRPDSQFPSLHTTWCSPAWRHLLWAVAGRSISATRLRAERCASVWYSSACRSRTRRDSSQSTGGRPHDWNQAAPSPSHTSTTRTACAGTAATLGTTSAGVRAVRMEPGLSGGVSWATRLGYHRPPPRP